MKLSKRNTLFTLVAAVLLGWGIFYTNCGTQQEAVYNSIDESGPNKSMGTQAMANCTVTGASGPSAGFAAAGYTCEIWYHCADGSTVGYPAQYNTVNGVANAECCRAGFVDCTWANGYLPIVMNPHDVATSPSGATSTISPTKTK